ncbi:MAG: glycosyltransferase, partial [Parcubacteria group bacterium LiPW_39]
MSTLIGKIKKAILLAGDIAVLYLALFLMLLLRYGHLWPAQWHNHFVPFTIIYFFALIVFYIIGLYEITLARNNLYFFLTLVRALIINAAIATGFFYFIPYFGIAPKTNLFINLIIFAILFTLWRQLYNHFIKAPTLLNNVLMLGQNQETKELIQFIKDNPQLGYRIKKIAEIEEVKILYDLIEVLIQDKIQVVVTTVNPYKDNNLVRNLYQCIPLKITVVDLPTFYEKITGKIPVSAIEEIWFLENLMAERKTFFEGIKKVVDIAFVLILGAITLLLTPLIALIIKLDSSGPVFLRQKRVGRDNRIFELIKFRSMFALAPDGSAEKNGARWTKEKDERVTRVGKFLRKTRLDELPQLWNVLKGEISFVGPRPERPEFAFSNDLLSKIPFYQIRHTIKPG